MIDILIFGLGVAVGAGGLYALYSLYSWMNKLKHEIGSLRNQLDYYRRTTDDWNEFQFWKREQQSKTK
jgi:hypothetical protein